MAVNEKAEMIKADYQSQLDKLAEVKTSLEQKIAMVDEMIAEHDAEVKASYDSGYSEGKASVVLPGTGTGEKLFTQEDMDALATVAKAEKEAEMLPLVEAAKAETEEVKAALEAEQAAKVEMQAAMEADAAKDAELVAQAEAVLEQIK